MPNRRMMTDPSTVTMAEVDLASYRGQYVAMLGKRVLAHGVSAALVFAEARTLLPQNTSPEAILMVQVPGPGLWIV